MSRSFPVWIRRFAPVALSLLTLPAAAQELGTSGTRESVESVAEPIGVVRVELLEQPPQPPVPLVDLEQRLARVNREVPVPVAEAEPAGPGVLPPSGPLSGGGAFTSGPPAVFLVRDALSGMPAKSTITEMASANRGRFVWATGNWWAARSTNQGASWSYVDPYSGFPDFCCDQDVIYDRGRDLLIWLRMGVPDGNGHNRFFLGVSTDDGLSFCTYVHDSPATEWYDYPHLALTSNYLYMTWNMFDAGDNYLRSRVLRWPLEAMSQCQGFNFDSFDDTGGTITPAVGGTSQAYFGQHRNTSTLRIYRWLEFDTSIPFFDRAIPAWTFSPRGSQSCAACGGDACARADNRITSGYVRRHSLPNASHFETVGFFWNVGQGGSFPFPYVENAWFYTTSGFVYGGRYLLWNTDYAWLFAAAHPDVRGNLGIVSHRAGGATCPGVCVGKDDELDGEPPGWVMTCPASMAGDSGPSNDTWGDYNRARPFMPAGTCWMGSGHVLQGGTTGASVHPLHFVFGNSRDIDGCYREWRLEP